MKLEVVIVNQRQHDRYFEDKSLANIRLTMKSKYVFLCVSVFFFFFFDLSHDQCRLFEHLVNIFLSWVAPVGERCRVEAVDMWPYIEYMWNNSKFTRSVTMEELSEYLIMTLEFGYYMPKRDRPRYLFPSRHVPFRFS